MGVVWVLLWTVSALIGLILVALALPYHLSLRLATDGGTGSAGHGEAVAELRLVSRRLPALVRVDLLARAAAADGGIPRGDSLSSRTSH